MVDAYRRIRNTLRFLLANTSDFDPAKDAVPLAELLEIDRYALARAAQFQAEVLAHYEVYEFHPVVAKLQVYLLRGPGRVLPRRAEGPPLHHRAEVAGAALRADRAVAHHARDAALDGAVPQLHRRGGVEGVRAGQPTSIFIETYCDIGAARRALLAKWTRIRASRELVNKEIEALRAAGKVGSSLQAEVDARAPTRADLRAAGRAGRRPEVRHSSPRRRARSSRPTR